jgi:amidase
MKEDTMTSALGFAVANMDPSVNPAHDFYRFAAGRWVDQTFADSQADVLVSVNNYHSQVYATANYPAITVPLGLRKNGMPVGVVLIGKPGSEAKLLSYAYALEQATKLRVDPKLTQK